MYEFLPLLFGGTGVLYYLRKGDLLGLMLSFWAVSSFFLYSLAGERMPWLVVNFAVPFILLTAKFIGDVLGRAGLEEGAQTPTCADVHPCARRNCGRRLSAPVLPWGRRPQLLGPDLGGPTARGGPGALAALLLRRSSAVLSIKVAGLGIGLLLLGFSAFVAFRANYSYDDSPVELIVYSQGSADLVRTAASLQSEVIRRRGCPDCGSGLRSLVPLQLVCPA